MTDEKLKEQVAVGVAGEMAQVNPTPALKLFIEVIVIVEEVELPIVVVAETGEAPKLKSFKVIK